MDTQKIRVAATKKPKRTTEQLIEAAKMRDAKMDRSRKTPTKEQKAAALLEAMINYNSVEKSAEEEADVETPKGEWDVKIGEPIEFFDPNLSYELTGYRPITKDLGLDFDPKLFTEAADSFRKNGRYTMYAPGTFKNKQFWTREWDRCCNGCTIGKYRLTGLNYFWLNYYRLLSSISQSDGEELRIEDFPGFINKQYEYFHYLELVKVLKKDGLAFKARGVGASEIAASNVAHMYTFHRASMSIVTAFLEDYVKTTLEKVWLLLNFLNLHTDGEFRHVRMKLDTDMHKRASKVDRDKNESGWMSEIKGITHDSPRKLRGFRANSIYFEECFAPDTLVIMSDYSRKRIEDIRVGEFVMGIDGTPQEVVRTNSGYNDLYVVKLLKGEDYITTANHKLYLERKYGVDKSSNRIELMTPTDYLGLSEHNKRIMYGLKSSGLRFNQSIEDLDPYFLGVLLGDGNIDSILFSINESTDPEIRDYILNYYNTVGLNLNKLLEIYRKYNLISNKHIPKEVYYASMEYRLKVLAGLIDITGNLKKESNSYSFNYEISIDRKELIDEIVELARSCGFYVYLNYITTSNEFKLESNSYRIIITGDLNKIPVLVKRKKVPQDYHQTSNPLSTSIKIENCGYNKYCGITLRSYGKDIDNLFLLNDYTIVHNCGSDPALEKTYIQAEALVNVGGKRIGSRYAFGCVCAGTKVWTGDGRKINIEDLTPDDTIIGYKNGKSNIEPITYILPEAYKPCVRITFDNGEYLECSEDHPILTRVPRSKRINPKSNSRIRWYEWKFIPAKDIIKKNYRACCIAACDKIETFGTDSLKDPYLIGLLIGDGTYGFNKVPRIANCDPEVLNYVKDNYSYRVERSHITKDNKVYEEVYIHKTQQMLRDCGIYGLTKTKKRLPTNFMQLDRESTRLLLAGLFDTDGYISKTQPKIVLTQSTSEILEQVQILLEKFGIKSGIKKVEPNISEGRKDKNPWYDLIIDDLRSFNNFKESIPIKIDYKRNALEKEYYLLNGHTLPVGIREVYVKSVEPIGVLRIYNLTANDSHTYLANNIITHNTGGDTGQSLAAMNKMFYNPKGYKILPYKNTYGQDGQVLYTGYFIPAYTMWFGDDEGNVGFDERGVVDEEMAKKHFLKMFESIEDSHSLLITRAEFCFTPEDAFILEGSNRFDQELLVELYNNITIHKTVPGPQAARLSWNINTETGGVDKDKRPKIEFISDGPLKVIELPKLDESGVPYLNLYVAGCLTPGEKVLTVSGLKNCEDVTLDDLLYSIQGKPVNIINLQQYYKENEDIYKVKLNNIFRTTTFTGEHPIYCATPEKHYHCKHKAQTYNLPYTYYKYNFGFKLMKDVKVGDFVKVPNIYKLEKPIPFDKWDESKVRIDFRVGNPISNPDFWWLIGLLLGDGWAESNNPRVCVVFNKQELFYIDKAKRIVNTLFGRTFNILKKDKSVEYYSINCKYLNKFFSENFGRGAKNKHIPEWVKFLPAELKLNLVMGYLASDGCVCVSSNSLNFVSCSYELLEGIQDILFSLGIINTVHYLRKTDKYYKVANSEKVNHISKAWTLDVHGDMINKFKRMVPYSDLKLDKWLYKEFTNHTIPRCFFEDESCDYIYIKISGIEHSKYTGIVYNYHCETSTFMCKYIPTHNCDAIDADNSTSTGQTDVSKFCVIIYKRAFGIDPPKPVAIYCERPQHIQTAFENALKLCAFYNCKLLVEATRISIKLYFEKEHKLHYLMRRPQATANKTTRTNFKQYGVPATEAIILHQLDLIELYIVDYSTEILFPELLDELIKYSYENKRKFDRVAAFGIVLLADEDMIGKTAKKLSFSGENIINLSYYKNDYGQIEFGVLEKQGTRREDLRDDLWNLWE